MEASARDGRMAASYKPAGEVARGPPDQYFSITFSFSCSLPTSALSRSSKAYTLGLFSMLFIS